VAAVAVTVTVEVDRIPSWPMIVGAQAAVAWDGIELHTSQECSGSSSVTVLSVGGLTGGSTSGAKVRRIVDCGWNVTSASWQ
jgi:hypothetical protein